MFFADETAPQCASVPVRTAKPTALNFSVAEAEDQCEEDEEENESADPNNVKCDVCGLGADPKLVQPCDIHTYVHDFTCNRPVCVTCSRTEHPLRHHSDDDAERGFFCRQHTQPNCYVLNGFTFGELASRANAEAHAEAHGYDLINGE